MISSSLKTVTVIVFLLQTVLFFFWEGGGGEAGHLIINRVLEIWLFGSDSTISDESK